MPEPTTWSCDCREGDDFVQRPDVMLRCGKCGAIQPSAPPPAATRTEPDHSLAVAYAKNVLEGTTLFGPSPDGLLNFARVYLSLVPSVPVPGSETGGDESIVAAARAIVAELAPWSEKAAHMGPEDGRFHYIHARLSAALRAPALGERKDCRWKRDEDGQYDTECGGKWFFDTGTPAENRAKFCFQCGGNLIDITSAGVRDARS